MDSDVTSPPPEQLKRLRQADWEDIYPKTLFWAKKWHDRYLSDASSPWEPEDLVQGAIDALCSGQRTLPKDVSVLTGIIKIMRSMAENIHQKKERQQVSFEERKGEGKGMDESSWLCEDALRVVEGDEILEKIVALLCEDPELKARDLAATLDVDVKEVYNAAKRMKRKVSQHLGG